MIKLWLSLKFLNLFLKLQKKFQDGIVKSEEDKKLIFTLINPNYEKISAKLIYSAKCDGDKANIFHNLCDKIGLPTLIIVETIGGKILGGYTKESWEGNSQYKIDEKAFIFSLDNKKRQSLFINNILYIVLHPMVLHLEVDMIYIFVLDV